MRIVQLLSLCMATCIWLWAMPAYAQEDGAEKELDDTAEKETTTWSLQARVRPRVEGRFNQHFGLDEDELNYSFQPDEADQFSQQTRLKTVVEGDHLSGYFTLQHTGNWGDFGGDELTAAPLHMYEARLRYRPDDRVFVDAGRLELAYGDQRVLGSVGWSQVGRAWDGFRAGLRPHEQVDIDGFAARYHDEVAGFIRGDSYLFGIYGSVDQPLGDVVDVVDIYVLYDVANLNQAQGRQLVMVGSRLGLSAADFDATAEGGVQYSPHCVDHGGCGGEEVSIRAFFVDAEAGYSIQQIRPFYGASIASGNDPETERIEAYDQMYPTGHAWLGYMDLIGPRTNLLEVRAGAQAQFGMVKIQLGGHHFRRLQPQSEPVGVELNTKLFIDVDDGFAVAAGGGTLFPARGISSTDTTPEGVASWAFAQLVASF